MPKTLLTYGCDPRTGAPQPGFKLTSKHVYSTICQALGVDLQGD